jgi:hypothetical protein
MIVTFLMVRIQQVPTREKFLPVPGTFTVHSVYWATYLTYMLVATTVTSVLLVVLLWTVRSWLARTSVLLLAIATTTLIAFLGSRVIAVFTYSVEPIKYGTYISSIHTIGVAFGCSIVSFIPLIQSFSAWRNANLLYPMWKALCTALPQIALDPPRPRVADALLPQDSQLRLHRRLVEIRDGLLILRDWVDSSDLDHIRAEIAETEVPADQADAAFTACWLEVALAAHQAGAPSTTGRVLDLSRHGGTDGESELHWLRKVAQVWSTPLVERCVSAMSARRRQGEPA